MEGLFQSPYHHGLSQYSSLQPVHGLGHQVLHLKTDLTHHDDVLTSGKLIQNHHLEPWVGPPLQEEKTALHVLPGLRPAMPVVR